MLYIIFTIIIMILLLYFVLKYHTNEKFSDCINYFNSKNKSLNDINICKKQFRQSKKQNLCSRLIELGWNTNWKQSDLDPNSPTIQELNKKIYKEFGNLKTSQIQQCFGNYI